MKEIGMRRVLRFLSVVGLLLHLLLLVLLLLPKPPLLLPVDSLVDCLASLASYLDLAPADTLTILGREWTGPALGLLLYLLLSLASLGFVLLYSLAARPSLLLLLPSILISSNLSLLLLCVLIGLLHWPSEEPSFLLGTAATILSLVTTSITTGTLAAELHLASLHATDPALLSYLPYYSSHLAPLPRLPPSGCSSSSCRSSWSSSSSWSSDQSLPLTQDHILLAPSCDPLYYRPCPPPGPYIRPSSCSNTRASYLRAPPSRWPSLQ